MEKNGTCAHEICACAAQEDSEYCSDRCRAAAEGMTEIACDCGHSGCDAG